MMKKIYSSSLFLFLLFPSLILASSDKIIISEFMAINSNNLVDGDGDYPDWIELYNNTDNPIDLNGWFISDKKDNLSKWQFPSITLPKAGYLIIFASEKDTIDNSGYLHTNFKLSGSGEYVALSEPDGTISSSYSPLYPTQRQDISYGIYADQEVYFTLPTPGAENNANDLPFAPKFSHTRGFYDTAVDINLTSVSGEAIYYTLDGTRPTKLTGTLYSTPINIATTTPLSAISVDASNVTSEIISHTYWFTKDILKQSNTPEGYPTDWKQAGSNTPIPADYEMDPEVVNDAEHKELLVKAMTDLPSMNIVTDIKYLFSDVKNEANGGIYIYTGKPSKTGVDWVRPASAEYFDPKTGKEFQINCRLKLHGGNSRNPSNSAKHGFELAFKSSYGPSKLNFDFFEEKGATKEFNSLVLRSGYNYSWSMQSIVYPNHFEQREKAQYLQDPWAKTTQLAMGKTSGHERFVHMYLNGLYWGIYNVAEEYTNDFVETYMKGSEEDFDIIKEKQQVTSGTKDAFNALVSQINSGLSNNSNYQKIQGKNADESINASYQNLLDMDNYIDYMLLNYYIGNKDWNKNNWTMVRNRVSNEAGFRFLCWDAETTMTGVNENIVNAETDGGNPADFIRHLTRNADFKVLLADRIQKHMIATGGALTPTEASDRYIELANEIDLPIIAESARWGDTNVGDILYTKNEHWLPRKQDLLENYFPQRTGIVIQQLKNKGYFPSVNAPVFTHEGGDFALPFDLGMTSNKGTIYFTTDGSDPRTSISAGVAPTASTYSLPFGISTDITVKARAKSGSEWSAITKEKFVFDPSAAVDDLIAEQLGLSNYPNPFHDQTQIHLNLPKEGALIVNIYGIDGRLKQNIYSGDVSAGEQYFTWTPNTPETGIFIAHIQYQGSSLYLKLLRK